MSQQFLAAHAVRAVLSLAEEDIVPRCKGPGVQGTIEGIRALVGVNAHVAEVGAYSALHFVLHRLIQPAAASTRRFDLVGYALRHWTALGTVVRLHRLHFSVSRLSAERLHLKLLLLVLALDLLGERLHLKLLLFVL